MIIIVKNMSGVDKNWGGYDYTIGEERTIEEVDRLRLLSDSSLISSVLDGTAVISDGDYDLSPRVALGIIQNNPIIMAQHYTLVQGDDVLIGNGQILYLNDEYWELDTPGEEEDV
jgi:hypothetical protein